MHYPGAVTSRTTVHTTTFRFQLDSEAVVTDAGARYQPMFLNTRYTEGHDLPVRRGYWTLTARRILKDGTLSPKVDTFHCHQLTEECSAAMDAMAERMNQ